MTPNRIIKESILTSPTLGRLSIGAHAHFFSVLLLSDDWGCFESTPIVIKGKCYSIRKRITEKRINEWQNEMENIGLIRRWGNGEREYAMLVNFDTHNRYGVKEDGSPVRHRRKTPDPPKEFNDPYRESRERDRENQKTAAANGRARMRGADGKHTKLEWQSMKERYDFRCAACGNPESADKKLERDHIIPLSRGGSNYIENLQPLCGACNRRKSNKIPALVTDDNR